jgi:YVTN family beta-propeller protein
MIDIVETRIRGISVSLLLSILGLCCVGSLGTDSRSSTRGMLLVVNKGDQTLSIVDPDSGRQRAAIPLGGVTGHEVAASPDGRFAFVPIYGNSGVGQPGTDGSTIAVIDLKSRIKVGDIDLKVPSRPHCAIFGPKDGRLYVTTELTNSIKVIDPITRAVVDSTPTGASQSHMLVISNDGERGYTSNVGDGTVSAIDLKNNKVLSVIPVAKVVQRIAISVDDQWVFAADQTKPELAVIDTHSNTVKVRVRLPALGYGITPTHDGQRLLITHPSSNSVSIVDLQTMKVERVIRVPADPQEIVARPDDRIAYVSCDEARQVVAINLSEQKIEKLINVGAGDDGMAWVPLGNR